MIYRISGNKNYEIRQFSDYVAINLPELGYLSDLGEIGIIKEMLKDNNIIRVVARNDDLYNYIVNAIINGYDQDELFKVLVDNKTPLFSFALSGVSFYRKKYLALSDYKNADIIYIDANKDDIISAFDLASKLPCNVIITTNDISLYDYKIIFDNYDISKIDTKRIEINYQEQNSSIGVVKLKELANNVYYIVDDLRKSNLSPIEKAMYVYDILKKKVYGRTEDLRDERDVDRVLFSDKMVCSGYSNLFNAILNCLEIKSVPIISDQIRHQRSMAYIKDPKYNLDGIYVFDPTWDRVKGYDDDNYDFFALPFNVSSKTFPTNYDTVLSLSFDEIINRVKESMTFETINSLSFLCSIIDNKLADEFNLPLASIDEDIRSKLYIQYLSFMASYKVEEIDFITFSRILYNVRRFEYYNDKCSSIDIDEIKDSVIERYFNIKRNELRRKKGISGERAFLELIKYNIELSDLIHDNFDDYVTSSIKGSDSIERDIQNIKLVKLLRKKSNS